MITVLQRGNRNMITGIVAALLAVVAFLAVSMAGTSPASAAPTPPVATLSSGSTSCDVYATGPFLTAGAGSKVAFGGKIICNQVRTLSLQVTLYYYEDGLLYKVAGMPKVSGTDTNIVAGNSGGTYVHTCEGEASTTYVIQLTATSDVGLFHPDPALSSTATLKCTPF
ncbi:MAG: hypothetical protein WBH47_18275 [Streptosporangiaceae bacterium]